MPTDSSSTLLIQHIEQAIAVQSKPLRILFVADENTYNNLDFIKKFDEKHSLDILTNRYEIYRAVRESKKNNVTAYFNDFDFSELTTQYDCFAYRISKEKPVVHHILNRFIQASAKNTRILLAGEKNDGIKTYTKNLLKYNVLDGTIKKIGPDYLADLIVKSTIGTNEAFETQDYTSTRPIKTLTLNQKNYEIYSKPGTYGWKKIDEGSKILCENFIFEESREQNANKKLIDLGCGSGLLSLAAHSIGIEDIFATDNNAAALASTQSTFNKNGISGKVIADDCAGDVPEKFDILLCNPPFHKGFDTSNQLTEQFVKAAKRLLKPKGKAYFVTNSFIGIEKIAKQYFDTIKTLENNKRFKVLRFS